MYFPILNKLFVFNKDLEGNIMIFIGSNDGFLMCFFVVAYVQIPSGYLT
jgi:hypothetical protein